MYEYLTPKDGPVVPGLEDREVVYAKNQPEYLPLRTIATNGPLRKVTSRWGLTAEQRSAVAAGADIFLTLFTHRNPLQPIVMAIGDDAVTEINPFILGE